MIELPALLARTLCERGHEAIVVADEVHLPSGLVLRPEHLATHRCDGNRSQGIHTASAITWHHPLHYPKGLFEYQHALDTDEAAALSSGFDAWARTDLPVLEDSLLPKPQHCMMMQMDFGGERAARQVLFGPVAQYVSQPAGSTMSEDPDEHEFCPCCLFTRSIETFMPLLQARERCGLRLYAVRDNDNQASADCRVNGNDYPDGASALVRYVNSWPQRGFEYRKQYVLIRNAIAQ